VTPPDESDTSASWANFATMGMTVAACVAIGVLLGIWADSKLHTSPLLLFIGLIVGCVVATVLVISQIRRFL
jgi:F0F1-type ATP synthase assembly protein I